MFSRRRLNKRTKQSYSCNGDEDRGYVENVRAGTSGRQPITPPRGGSLNKAAGPAPYVRGSFGWFCRFFIEPGDKSRKLPALAHSYPRIVRVIVGNRCRSNQYEVIRLPDVQRFLPSLLLLWWRINVLARSNGNFPPSPIFIRSVERSYCCTLSNDSLDGYNDLYIYTITFKLEIHRSVSSHFPSEFRSCTYLQQTREKLIYKFHVEDEKRNHS